MAEDNVPGGPPVGGAAAVVGPQWPWVVLFTVLSAGLSAYDWATATPVKALATFLMDQARGFGMFLIVCGLAGALGNRRRPFDGLRLPLSIVPFYLVGLVPRVASATVGWEGGWTVGIAGAAVGAAAGAVAGWLFTRWILVVTQSPRIIVSGTMALPIAFAVLFAVYGAHNWSTMWLATLDEAWAIVCFPITFAFLGALVRRPLLGLLSALPLVPVQLIPFVASLTVGWEGGWILGIAGAVAGAAAGAANGWLYSRWIMPEYEKRRARESAVQQLEASLTSTSGDLFARVGQILKGYGSGLYLAPSIPPNKLANATTKACVPADEKVLGLIDCTVFGSASSCLVFGSRGFYYSEGCHSNPGGAGQTILAQDRKTQTAIVRTAPDRLGELGRKIAQFASKLERMFVPGSVAYSEFSRCQFTTSGLFWIRLDRDRWCSAAGSKVSRQKIIAILTAIQQAVVELAGHGAEAGGGLSAIRAF